VCAANYAAAGMCDKIVTYTRDLADQ